MNKKLLHTHQKSTVEILHMVYSTQIQDKHMISIQFLDECAVKFYTYNY